MSYELHLGDCLELMKALPSGSVDMVLCDLPYGTTACAWDTVIPFAPLWAEYKRITKPTAAIVLFGSQPFTTALIASNMTMFRYEWIWQKNFSGGFVNAKLQPMKYHENIVVFYEARPTYNPQFEDYADSVKKQFASSGVVKSFGNVNAVQGVTNVPNEVYLERGAYPKSIQKFPGVPNSNKTRVHPTQKPVALLEYLIRTYTNEGETVLDNTMGSGSTGVACINTRRNFIGMELTADYFAIAQKRIEAAQQQHAFNLQEPQEVTA